MAWKATKKEMDVVQYNYDNYEARKENFKVEKIIFVSFHAEGVGTQRQSTVEGRFFSSPMRTWLYRGPEGSRCQGRLQTHVCNLRGTMTPSVLGRLLQISHSISQAKPQCSGWLGAAGEFPSSIRSPNPGEAGVKAGDPFRKL